MNGEESKRTRAIDYATSAYQQMVFACRRGCELSDEFNRLEVQIAALLFTFGGAFLAFFGQGLGPETGVFGMKLTVAVALSSLVISLIVGLLHIKRKEKFWDDVMAANNARWTNWGKLLNKPEVDFDVGVAFHSGVSQGKEGVSASPTWTWVVQTVFLGIGVGLLMILAFVILFR